MLEGLHHTLEAPLCPFSAAPVMHTRYSAAKCHADMCVKLLCLLPCIARACAAALYLLPMLCFCGTWQAVNCECYGRNCTSIVSFVDLTRQRKWCVPMWQFSCAMCELLAGVCALSSIMAAPARLQGTLGAPCCSTDWTVLLSVAAL